MPAGATTRWPPPPSRLRTNPLARSVYQALQARYVGPDPLAVGGCEWPETLTSGQVIHVAETEPLLGWRMWSVAETQAEHAGSTRSSGYTSTRRKPRSTRH